MANVHNLVVYNVDDWLEENEKDFVPPVCNKCMFSDQLKVFFIGGPNQRKDYHLEEGEEVFYQQHGDMTLKVFERGVFRDITIKEGKIFLLPGRVHHSPQRNKKTIGFVVERTRNSKERDALRYFKDEAISDQDILFERWMHLTDVVKDLPPIIAAYFNSSAHATRQPDEHSLTPNDRAYEADGNKDLMKPINLIHWIHAHQEEILTTGFVTLFGKPTYATTVNVFGFGKHSLKGIDNGETLVWMIIGSGHVTVKNEARALNTGFMGRIPVGKNFSLMVDIASYCVTIVMPTPLM